MKRLLLFAAFLALLLPSLAFAALRTAGDGTLSVRDGRGTFTINAKGGVIGSFAKGRVIITDPIPDDGTGPIVSFSGADDWHHEKSDTTDVYGGTKVRFRMIGGTFKIRVIGRGINLSVIGKGTATLNGEDTGDDGAYSINGADYLPILPDVFTFTLNASTGSP
jgi:opacity protein-like surface antigen